MNQKGQEFLYWICLVIKKIITLLLVVVKLP